MATVEFNAVEGVDILEQVGSHWFKQRVMRKVRNRDSTRFLKNSWVGTLPLYVLFLVYTPSQIFFFKKKRGWEIY
jgi:hypothetical protein